MPTLNEINRRAKLAAEKREAEIKERQDAERKLAMINATIVFITACVAIIAVGSIYHGGLGWLL